VSPEMEIMTLVGVGESVVSPEMEIMIYLL